MFIALLNTLKNLGFDPLSSLGGGQKKEKVSFGDIFKNNVSFSDFFSNLFNKN